MAYLQELIPQRFFDRWDYLRSLRALLPRGIAWQIPLPNEIDIQPVGIVSGEAFGRHTVSSGEVYITPNGIVSSEAFGLAYVLPAQDVELIGIVSAEAFGVPSVLFGQVISEPSGIESQENFGSPIIVNSQFITPIGIVSGEVVSDAGVWNNLLIYDDFDGGVLNPAWDAQFKSGWGIETEAGENYAESPTNNDDWLYPTHPSSVKAGEFEIHFGYWRSAGGNNSVHFKFYNTASTFRFDSYFWNGVIYGLNGGQFTMASGPAEQRMKIVRDGGGIIWAYYWNGSAWIREDAWSTPGSSFNNNENLWLAVNGGAGENGFSHIYIMGTFQP